MPEDKGINPEVGEQETPEQPEIDVNALKEELDRLKQENEFLKQAVANPQPEFNPRVEQPAFSEDDYYDPQKLVEKLTETVAQRVEQTIIPKLQQERIKQEAAVATNQTLEHYRKKYNDSVAEFLRIQAANLAQMNPQKYAMLPPSQAVAEAFKDAEKLWQTAAKAFAGTKSSVPEEVDSAKSVGRTPEKDVTTEWQKALSQALSEGTVDDVLDTVIRAPVVEE